MQQMTSNMANMPTAAAPAGTTIRSRSIVAAVGGAAAVL